MSTFKYNGESGISISKDWRVYYFGDLGSDDEVLFPKLLPNLKNICQVSVGVNFFTILTFSGEVFVFGESTFVPDNLAHKPTKIHDLPLIKQISTTEYCCIFLSEKGELFSIGSGDYGELGIGHFYHCEIPQKISKLSGIEFIECGKNHVICVDIYFDIYVWGRNESGQLGINHFRDVYKPFKCKDWPHEVVDIKCGDEHTLVLTSTGCVYSCGSNLSGQLGRLCDGLNDSKLKKITKLLNIVRIECGRYYSICVDIRNVILLFGDNSNGELGFVNSNGDYQPKISFPKRHPFLVNIIDISSGGTDIFFKSNTNAIFSFSFIEKFLDIPVRELFSKKMDLTRGLLVPKQIFKELDIWCPNITKMYATKLITAPDELSARKKFKTKPLSF